MFVKALLNNKNNVRGISSRDRRVYLIHGKAMNVVSRIKAWRALAMKQSSRHERMQLPSAKAVYFLYNHTTTPI